MPDPANPVFEDWAREMDRYRGRINEGAIMIGKSAGYRFAAEYLLARDLPRISVLMGVGPWLGNATKYPSFPFGLPSRALSDKVSRHIVLASLDDEPTNIAGVNQLGNHFGAQIEIHERAGYGHFNVDRLPLVEEILEF